MLLGVVVHDDLLFAFPRIDSQAGGAACSCSWGMQIASLVGLQFSLCNGLSLDWSIAHKREIGISWFFPVIANPLKIPTPLA